MRIVLATCRTWPELSASDQCLAAVLRDRDHVVDAAPWNDTFTPFERADAVVVRSTWDYHEAPDSYAAWLARLDARRTFNAPALIRWNLSKRYLLDLEGRGARVPRSRESAAEPAAVAAALAALGLGDAVLKPLIGASGFGVERVRAGDEVSALARARAGKPTDRVLVQEFLPGIAAGEVAGVFFGGRFSHALRRLPAPGEFRINSRYGGRMEAATLPDDVITHMRRVLALLPEAPMYARIDGVASDREFVTMEVEVNEPGLGLNLAPGSAERFADALLAVL